MFKDEGITVLLNTSPESISHDGKQFSLQTNHGQSIQGDQLLVATGREPNTATLNVDVVAVKTDNRGGGFKTNSINFYQRR